MDVKTTIAPSDYDSLIAQGITDAKGSADAITFLTDDDLKNLGKLLAKREAVMANLFSVDISPIHSLKDGIRKGGFDNVYGRIMNGYVLILLANAKGRKRVYFIPVIENVNTGEEEAYVRKFGFTLCKQASNYMLGAMAEIPENKMPEHLDNMNIVAIENEGALVVQHTDDRRSFLIIVRSGDERGLSIVDLSEFWSGDAGWVFLAEKP